MILISWKNSPALACGEMDTVQMGGGASAGHRAADRSGLIHFTLAGGWDWYFSSSFHMDAGLIPGSGRYPEGRHGNSLQYSCLENPHGWRSLAGYSPPDCKESDRTERLNNSIAIIVRLPCPIHIHGFSQLQIKKHFLKTPESSKKQNLIVSCTGNYSHNIYTILAVC